MDGPAPRRAYRTARVRDAAPSRAPIKRTLSRGNSSADRFNCGGGGERGAWSVGPLRGQGWCGAEHGKAFEAAFEERRRPRHTARLSPPTNFRVNKSM
ncbi:unnamed protein product, partial [Iphiclides podalirius]